MKQPWELRKSEADQYTPAIKRIIGQHLLAEGSIEQDRSECGDLVLVVRQDLRDLRIGCRVRNANVAARWPHQVTFRSACISGAKTEWEKVMYEGIGDWFFYGFAAANPGQIGSWTLINLVFLRGCLFRIGMKNASHMGIIGERVNGDNETAFAWLDLAKLRDHRLWDPRIIIAQSMPQLSVVR